MMINNKLVCWLLIFGLVPLVFSLSSCGGEKERTAEKVAVTRGNIRAVISSTGIVQPRNRLEIRPPIAGRIEAVLVQEGERVAKGETLAWISSNDRAALLDAARAKGEAEVKHWEEVYKAAPIVSPLDGFIIQRGVEPGQSVTAGDAVLVMADRLGVKARVDETDIGRIRLGQKVNIELDSYPGQKIAGKVSHIAYESQTINNVIIYEVDILPDKVPDFFRSGMSATVEFILNEKRSVLLLPLKAVRKSGDRAYVFPAKYGEKGSRPLQVTAGLENTTTIQIVSGLTEGEEVFIPTAKMLEKLQNQRWRGPRTINPFEKKN